MQLERAILVSKVAVLLLATSAFSQESVTTELTRVEARHLAQSVVLPGELEPFQSVLVRAKVAGFVESIPVDRGSRVRKGALIALLHAPELEAERAEAAARLAAAEAELAQAEAQLAASQNKHERLSKAAQTPGVVAGNDLVQAEKMMEADRARVTSYLRSVEAAKAALKSIEDMASYLRVTAPFDGVITERRVHVGTLVGADSASGILVKLEQLHPLRLVTPVPESYVGAVAKGTKVQFSVSAYPGESFSAAVARPALSIAPETRTMAVEADVDNLEGRLSPGMYAEVSWSLRRPKESLLVPRTAIEETTERVFVIRVNQGKAEWVDVLRGASDGEMVEVFGRLAPNDPIVVRASDEIRPGTVIQPR